MKLGIRDKFIGILIVAAVVPLLIGLILIEVLGYRYYKRDQGQLFQSTAAHLATTLNLNLARELHRIEDWVGLTAVVDYLEAETARAGTVDTATRQAQIDDWEERWPRLAVESPELQSLLSNPVASHLVTLLSLNPLIAEAFVTDDTGRVVATTRKTSDYNQADENWWQRAMQVREGFAYLEGINYDQSAGVYSVDICLPIRSPKRPYDAPAGVLKVVVDAVPLFSDVPRILADDRPARQILTAEGDIVLELFRDDFQPMHAHVDPSFLGQLADHQPGWDQARLDDRGPRLVGYAPLSLGVGWVDQAVASGIAPMWVLVHDDARLVLAPVRRQLWVLAISGALLLVVFGFTGLYIANQKLLAPIQTLRHAAKSIAESAKLDEIVSPSTPLHAHPECARRLESVRQIQTRDEFQDLAGDFGSMAQRVLTYHEHLEIEIAAKTAELQRDLMFAREFQEALMPRHYPQVPSEEGADPLELNFHHIYKPTSSLGGDFFDVVKISDHQAGVFIADVMGHGARSALVTAILRTLLQDLAVEHGSDPAHFLADLNRHFYEMTSQSNQFIFVSAFYLVIDTRRSLATYASAGHPSPYLAERAERKVRLLIERLENNPALGLYRDSRYTNFTSVIKPGDLFVLFTDGVLEVSRLSGEDFGRQRLEQVITDNLDLRVNELCEALLGAVMSFTTATNLPDDLCLVGVEVNAPANKRPAATAAGVSRQPA